jgi:hypothetical protein
MKALTNTESVICRFCIAEHAEHHCGIGNIRLPLDIMLKWIEENG